MKVELISIGDELLIGQTVNTNATWIGEQLSLRGVAVIYGTTIQDDENSITSSLSLAMNRSDVVIITGGLGPTLDDITKSTLAKFFDTSLVIDESVLARIQDYFEKRELEMLDVNIQQAALPESAYVLKNDLGTASGMWFEEGGKVVISLPGVPYEMKHILGGEGFKRLFERFNIDLLYSKTISFQGIGESYLAEQIQDVEIELIKKGVKLAYLPSTSALRMRFNAVDSKLNQAIIEDAINTIEARLPRYLYARNEVSLSEVVGALLLTQEKTLATVESCTGGGIANEITKIAGCSKYFKGSIVCYANEVKISNVNVSEVALEKYGAVSREVVEQMAINGKAKLNVDYCISTSGVAGPDGGSSEKPVGFVWIAIATPEGVFSLNKTFGNSRERIIKSAVLTSLNLLRCELMNIL